MSREKKKGKECIDFYLSQHQLVSFEKFPVEEMIKLNYK
jgi:hypothetical protein